MGETKLFGDRIVPAKNVFLGKAENFRLIESVLDQVRECIYVIGLDYRYAFANHQALACEDWRSDEIIGRHVAERIGNLLFRRLVKPRLDRSFRGEHVSCRHWIKTGCGKHRYFDVLVTPFREWDGTIGGAVVTMRDQTAQKELQQELRDQADLYRHLVENSMVGIAILQDHEMAFANQAIASMFGYESIDAMRKQVRSLSFVAADDRQRVRAFEQAHSAGHAAQSQYQFDGVCKNGRIIHILASTNHVFWQGRRACQLVVTDITKQKNAEQALAANAASFQDVVEGSLQGFCAIDGDRYVYINRAFADLLGYSVDEMMAAPVDTCFPDYERPRTREYRRKRYRRNPASEVYEIDGLHKSGRIVRLQICVRLTENWFGMPALLSFVIDVTDRHRAQKALQDERNLLRAMIDNIPAVVFAKDRESRFLIKNKEGAAFVGEADATDLTGRSNRDYYPSDLEARFRAAELAVMESGEPLIDYENDIVCPGTGEVVTTSACIAPLLDADGETIGIVGIAQDITKFRQSEKALRESEQRFRDLAEVSSDWFWEMDADLRFTYLSERARQISGDNSKVLRKRRMDLAIEIDDNWRAHADDLKHRRPFRDFRYAKRLNDGSTRHVSTSGMPLFDANGGFTGYRGAATDITKEVETQQALARERNLLRAIINNIPDAIYAKDREARFILNNHFDATLMGADGTDDTIGKTDFDFYPEAVADDFYRDDMQVIESGDPIIGKVEQLEHAGDTQPMWYNTTKTPLRDADGNIIGLIGVSRDITEAKLLADRLHHQATHDPLTGLLNRSAFEDRLNETMEKANACGHSAVLCYIDFDQFKVLNDSAGHMAGDQLIRQLATLFEERADAASATVARLGGDEFGLLIDDCQLDRAERIAQDLIDAVGTFRFFWNHRSFAVSISIGMTTIHAGLGDVGDALAQADVACYAAKDNGRNRLCIYRSSDQETRQRHDELLRAASLKQAIETDGFHLVAQPIVRLGKSDMTISHYEILLRLSGADGTLLMPGAFIPAAERYGLMSMIDQWVVGTSLEMIRGTARPVDGQRFSINISAHSLADDAFQETLRHILKETTISTESLCFEITETAVISNLGRAKRFVGELRDMGCRIALDDFGCGLSSFSYLKHFPVDYIKIDGSFIRQIATDETDRAIVEAINYVGHVGEIETVAECVEDEVVIDTLRELSVDYAQGLAIGPPVPLGDVVSGHRASAMVRHFSPGITEGAKVFE